MFYTLPKIPANIVCESRRGGAAKQVDLEEFGVSMFRPSDISPDLEGPGIMMSNISKNTGDLIIK